MNDAIIDSIVIGLILLTPFSMGVSVGLTILTYTLSSGTDLPPYVLAITGGAPLIPTLLMLRKGLFRLQIVDGAVLCFFTMRFFSAFFEPWFTEDQMLVVLKEVIFGLSFYFCGRLFVFRQKQAGFALELLVSLLAVFVIYEFSGPLENFLLVDRAVLGIGEPVGLSLVFNVLLTLVATIIIVAISKTNKRQPNPGISARLWQHRMVLCIIAGLIGIYALSFLIANGTRGALSAVIAASILTLGLPFITAAKPARTAGMCFVAIAATIFGLFSLQWYVDSGLDPNNRFDNFAQALAVFTGILNQSVVDPTLVERHELMRRAIDLFFSNPILGCGFNCTDYFIGIYPHNLLIQVLAENGLLGGILISIILAVALRGGVAALRQRADPDLVILSAIFISILTQSMVSFSVNHSRFLMFFVGACVSTISCLRNVGASAKNVTQSYNLGQPAILNMPRRGPR